MKSFGEMRVCCPSAYGVKVRYSSKRASERFSKIGRCRVSVRVAKGFLQTLNVNVVGLIKSMTAKPTTLWLLV